MTKLSVGDVRAGWQRDPKSYERLFDQIGVLVGRARPALEMGDMRTLGELATENQELLRALQVSSPEIERLAQAATDAGAFGAKLSGGGRGGNVIAVIDPSTRQRVRDALVAAGARRVIVTKVG